MINIIITIDPTTEFLNAIVANLKAEVIPHTLIEVHPFDDSYKSCLELVKKLEKKSTIVFLGHGSEDAIYGGESAEFKKKSFVKLNQMGVFREQMICILACNSARLLKSSFKMHNIFKCIGFGGLPTSMDEIIIDQKLASFGFNDECIEKYKTCIVDAISRSLVIMEKSGNHDFIFLRDYLSLTLSKMINKAVIEDKEFLLAELLFKMKSEMVLY